MNTNSTLENNGETKELFNHIIKCPDNKLLKQYKFIRQWQLNPPTFNYHYECIDNPNKSNDFIDKETPLNDYGNGQHVYFDRHNIECLPTHALNKIQLTGQIDHDPKQIQYKYKCVNANINHLNDHNTGFNDEGNSIVYFDRHNISCPDNTVLNSVKLNRGQDENGNWNKIRFDYKCGIISQSYDYINSNNIDKDRAGNPTSHVKSHIQSLILYYGNYKKDLDTQIISSYGGDIASKMVIIISDMIKASGAQYEWRQTQSDSWCPLIWKALQLAGKNIKSEWTRYIPAQDILDETAKDFFRMNGWVEYADYILTHYQDPRFENSFDNIVLQNESKKIKLHLRIQNALNIDNKDIRGDGHINTEIQNIIQHYANGVKITRLDEYELNNAQTKKIFTDAAIFNGQEQIYSIIFVPLIWKAIQLCGYNVPNEWTLYKKADKQNQMSQDRFNDLATRLSRINGFAEYALYCILDYNYNYNDRYNSHTLEWKYILHQNDIITILFEYDFNTNLTIREQIELLYKRDVQSMMGGYKQKYFKYKQKYMKIKRELSN